MLHQLQDTKNDTQQKIISGTLDVLRNYGLKYGTIDMIATHLGMPKKLIYKNFNNKKSLVSYVITDRIQDTKNKLEAVIKTINDAIGQMFITRQILKELIETLNTKVIHQLKKYFPESFKEVVDFNNKFLYHYVEDNLKKGIAQGVYSRRIDEKIISAYLVENFILPASHGPLTEGKFREKDKDNQLMFYHFFGIITEEGNRYIWKYINKLPEKFK